MLQATSKVTDDIFFPWNVENSSLPGGPNHLSTFICVAVLNKFVPVRFFMLLLFKSDRIENSCVWKIFAHQPKPALSLEENYD